MLSLLIDISTNIVFAITSVLSGRQLMCMPRKVNIERGYEKRRWG